MGSLFCVSVLGMCGKDESEMVLWSGKIKTDSAMFRALHSKLTYIMGTIIGVWIRVP